MTQENPTEQTEQADQTNHADGLEQAKETKNGEEPQGERTENAEQEVQYYYSMNPVWRGQGLGMRRTHHKSKDCRIGRRIQSQNRIEGRREDTEPCQVCCMGEIVEQSQEQR